MMYNSNCGHDPTEALLERFCRDSEDVYDAAVKDETVPEEMVERLEVLKDKVGCLRY